MGVETLDFFYLIVLCLHNIIIYFYVYVCVCVLETNLTKQLLFSYFPIFFSLLKLFRTPKEQKNSAFSFSFLISKIKKKTHFLKNLL